VNDLFMGSWKGKEKERDIIDEIYQIVMELKENLRKIKVIKSFFYELSYSSSSLQQPSIITGLGQTPIIETNNSTSYKNGIAANTTSISTITTTTRTKK
jgi:hypothetical protein